MSGIKRTLPTNQYLAALNANNPSALNPFITEIDSAVNTASLVLYPTTAASGIPTYNLLVNSITDPNYDDPAVDLSTGAISGPAQLIASLASAPGVISGNPGTVNVNTIGNIRRVSGSGTATFYFEVYHRDNLGTETLIGTSNTTYDATSAVYEQFFASALVTGIVFNPTDRVVTKWFANRIAGGSNPTYEIQIGGPTPVKITFPVPFVALPPSVSYGKLGIADANGQYTYYSDYTTAMAAAVAGQTIEQFADIVETGAVTIALKDDVNINMNGHTYTSTYAAGPLALFVGNGNVVCQFQNGTIIIDSGASLDTVTGLSLSLFSSIDASGLTIKVISSGGLGKPVKLGTSSCILRNITCFSIDSIAIDADSSAILYNCYGQSVTNSGILLGNTSATNSNSKGYNCIGRSTNGYGILVGHGSEAIECVGISTSNYAMYVYGGIVIGGYATSNSTGLYAITVDQFQDKNFRIRGVEISGGSSNPAVILVYDGVSTVFGVIESCSIIAGNSGDGIQLNTNGVFQNKLIVTNNNIRVVTAGNNCLVGTAASTYCNYAQNIFAGATTPVNANVLQGVVNTPDNQGNILI